MTRLKLFPNSGPTYYNEDKSGIKSYYETCYLEASTINFSYWNEGHQNQRFYCNDASLWNGFYGGSNWPINKRQFNFGLIQSIINMIHGIQLDTRKTMVAFPKENGDDYTADQITKVLMWCCQQDGILETISKAFHGSIVSGMGFIKLWLDYRKDPVSGNLRADYCAYNSVIMDPYWRKTDLSDCRYLIQRDYISKREAISLLPELSEEILNLTMGSNAGPRDGKFYFQPESFNFSYKNLITYDEFYYRDFRSQKLILDTQTGETTEYKDPDEDRLRDVLQRNPTLTVIDTVVPTVKHAILLNGQVMSSGPNPMGIDDFNIVPLMCYYTPDVPEYNLRIRGVVSGLRDPQFLFNRFILIISDIFESQIQSGWKYKEDALVNPMDVFLNGQGKGLALKRSAQMTDVEKIPAADAPQSMFQILDVFKDLLYRSSNVSEEQVGQGVQDISGLHAMLRMGAGRIGLKPVFEEADRAQNLLGTRMIDIIQNNFAPGKVKKILEGEEPSDWFYKKAFGDYHCVVQEGLLTSTQRQMQYTQMQELFQLGIVTKEDMLDAATIQGKTKIMENAKKQNEQQAQMAQKQAQVEQAELQSRIQLAQSTAKANEGLYQERSSRVYENFGIAKEREADARRQDAAAELDHIKTLKELEGIPIGHLKELISLHHLIEDRHKQEQLEQQAATQQMAQPQKAEGQNATV